MSLEISCLLVIELAHHLPLKAPLEKLQTYKESATFFVIGTAHWLKLSRHLYCREVHLLECFHRRLRSALKVFMPLCHRTHICIRPCIYKWIHTYILIYMYSYLYLQRWTRRWIVVLASASLRQRRCPLAPCSWILTII